MIRWSLILQEYDFEIEYIKGKENFTDYLSRLCSEANEDASLNTDTQPIDTQCFYIRKRQLTVVKPEDQRRLLETYHTITGHGGVDAMKHAILPKYTWNGANKDIKTFVKQCTICLRARSKRRNREVISIKTKEKNELWELDIVGPFTPSEEGHRYILTKIDHYSRTGDALALKNKTAQEVINTLRTHFIARHGRPKTILMDNGLEFKNHKMSDLAQELGFEIKHSSPYHPQSTGAVEKFNDTLSKKLKKLTNFGEIDWRSTLEKAVIAYNNSISRPLGITPNEFVTKKRELFAIDRELGVINNDSDITDAIKRLEQRIQKYRREYSIDYQKTNKFQVGNACWYYDVPTNVTKLGTKWILKGVITEVMGNSYIIEDCSGKKFRVNEEHLRKDESNTK